MLIVPRARVPATDDARQDTASALCQEQGESPIVDEFSQKPELIFKGLTPVGHVLVWRSHRAGSVVFDVRVDDPETSEEVERHRVVRKSRMPFRHTLYATNGQASFSFVDAINQAKDRASPATGGRS